MSVTCQEWLTAEELAQVLKIKVPTVRLWTRQGMPCLRCGRLRRFNLNAVLAWLEDRAAPREAEDAPLIKVSDALRLSKTRLLAT